MVGLIFKLVVPDWLLLSRFSMDKDILYTKLKLSIRKKYQKLKKLFKKISLVS